MSKTAPINEYRVLINKNSVMIIARDDVAIAMHELVNVCGDKLHQAGKQVPTYGPWYLII